MAQIAEIIKYEGDNSTFIWKHPCEDFNSLTVKPICVRTGSNGVITFLLKEVIVLPQIANEESEKR